MILPKSNNFRKTTKLFQKWNSLGASSIYSKLVNFKHHIHSNFWLMGFENYWMQQGVLSLTLGAFRLARLYPMDTIHSSHFWITQSSYSRSSCCVKLVAFLFEIS